MDITFEKPPQYDTSRSYIRPRMKSIKKKETPDPEQLKIASQAIMERMTKRMIVKKKSPSYSDYKPIMNFEFYYSMSMNTCKKKYIDAVRNLKDCRKYGFLITEAVNDLDIAMTFMKAEETRLEKMKELQVFIPTIPCKVIEPLPERIEMDHVVVNLKVQKKSKNVKVKMTTPLLDLYEKYYKNLKRPPIGDKIRLYNKLGYPEWYLEKMLESYTKQMKRKPEIEQFIISVFAKYDAKKPSKTKPKTLLQKLGRNV
jgi:hypothetical protein